MLSGAALARAEWEVTLRLWLDRSALLDDYALLSTPPDEQLLALLARHQIRRGDWEALRAVLARMPATTRNTERWRYWDARARAATIGGGAGHETFFELSESRTFYGFMAAERIDQPLAMNDTGSPRDGAAMQAMLERAATRRVIELMALDRRTDARREWFQLLNRVSDTEARALAHIARLHGWHAFAIRATIQAELWNDLELRFPLGWIEQFQTAARETGLAPQWLLGIARQESALDADARSPVGARGLMQLMPDTAIATARAHALATPAPDDLTRPTINIPLGARYYASMLDRFDGNRALAAAAYNAGPHRVRGWLRMPDDLPLDAWIETIPFRETRGYVQNVLAFAAIYSWRQGLSPRLILEDERRVRARP